MIDVTCFHCGQTVQISPDVERCAACGTNLRKLLGREMASGYFYNRAADMASVGNVLGAQQEVQRGLAYVATSELNLLGAILCKRLGRLEDMRHYVAAIPVDDPLRGEAEWLLRSNQARQRASIDNRKADRTAESLPVVADADVLPMLMDEVNPSKHHSRQSRPGHGVQIILLLAVVAVVASGAWIVWQNAPGGIFAWLPGAGPAMAGQNGQPQAENEPVVTQAPTTEQKPAEPSGKPDVVTPAGGLPLPTPTIPNDLVKANGTAESLAGTNPDLAVEAAEPQKFDWQAVLKQAGREDLAALPVTGRIEGDQLIVEGTVATVEQRAAIEFQARQVPGVTNVSVVNVKVRLPETYTVQDGDTLWDISVRLYGDADQVDDLFAANQDVMSSANALRVGMVLKVPKTQ